MIALVNLLAGPPNFIPLQIIRMTLLRILGMRLGYPPQISEAFYVLNGSRVSIGAGGRLGSFCRIWDFAEVKIGRNLLASHNLTIVAGTHNVEDFSAKPGPVFIGHNVWIGANVTIIGPVRIGDGCVIGAGSVVIYDLPDNAVAVGAPARVTRLRA